MNKLSLTILFLLFIGLTNANSQIRYGKLDYYTYLFIKNIEWPKETLQDTFRIATFGETEANGKLKILADKQRLKGLPTELLVFHSIDEIKDCHTLFIPRKYDEFIESIVKKVKKHTVIITERPGHAFKGSAININWDSEFSTNMHFEVNSSAFSKGGLKMSDALAHNRIK